jgi:hypothetical protein
VQVAKLDPIARHDRLPAQGFLEDPHRGLDAITRLLVLGGPLTFGLLFGFEFGEALTEALDFGGAIVSDARDGVLGLASRLAVQGLGRRLE